MDDEQNEVIQYYKKRIEPFVAIFILAFLIVGIFLLYQDNQLKKEIGKNCGYETKDYVCYCDKAFIDAKRIEIEEKTNGGFVNINVTLARNNNSESNN